MLVHLSFTSYVVRHISALKPGAQSQGRSRPHSHTEKTTGRPETRIASRVAFCCSLLLKSYFTRSTPHSANLWANWVSCLLTQPARE